MVGISQVLIFANLGLGPIKAKGRLIIKLNGLFMFGGNTAKVLMLAKLGQGVPRNKKPVKS